MQRGIGQIWLAALMGVALVSGCEWGAQRTPYATDPLLVSRKPVEAKVDKTEPALVARGEPVAPEPPSTAVATAPVDLTPAAKIRLAARPEAVDRSSRPAVPATPVSRRRTPGE